MYETYRIEYTYTDPWDKTISDYHYCYTKDQTEEYIGNLILQYPNLERLFVTHSKQLI